MPVLPPELWAALDASLGEIDLRLSPERALIRLQEFTREQGSGTPNEKLFVTAAAICLAGAFACQTEREARARQAALRAAPLPLSNDGRLPGQYAD